MQIKNESEKDALETKESINIYMPAILREKIRGWINACSTECGGLGTIIQDKNGNLIIDNVFIVKQVASSGYFRLCNKDRCKRIELPLIKGEHDIIDNYINKYIEDSEEFKDISVDDISEEDMLTIKQDIGKSIYSRMNFHWHSHVNMPTFWSGQDVDAADEMLQQHGWAVMLVGNKSGNILVKYVQKNPKLVIDNIDLNVVTADYTETYKKCREEINELVKSMTTHSYDEDKDEVVEGKSTMFPIGGSYYNPRFGNRHHRTSQNIRNWAGYGDPIDDPIDNHITDPLIIDADEEEGITCPACNNVFVINDENNLECPRCHSHVIKDFNKV